MSYVVTSNVLDAQRLLVIDNGYGVHFCLGAALARMEVNGFFSELVPRLESIELTGCPQHIAPRGCASAIICLARMSGAAAAY